LVFVRIRWCLAIRHTVTKVVVGVFVRFFVRRFSYCYKLCGVYPRICCRRGLNIRHSANPVSTRQQEQTPASSSQT
jgi:hypothetical protein